MERKFGVIASCLPHSELENLAKIKEAGFDTVFLSNYTVNEVVKLQNEAVKQGIYIESIHAPFFKIIDKRWYTTNDYWMEGEGYLNLYNEVIESIDAASEAGIPAIVHHLSAGWTAPKVCDLGLARYDALVEYAEKKNVKIALENLHEVGHIACVIERFENNPYVGFCYDCGHEYCYTEDVHFLDLFHKKLICTHIHDNFGIDHENPTHDMDIHVLPYDGGIPYDEMMKRFNSYGCNVPLTLETGKSGVYAEKYTDEEWLVEAHKRLERLYDEVKK